jgi:uncharacterized protein DUF3306
MSDSESFVARWSRRKRQAAQDDLSRDPSADATPETQIAGPPPDATPASSDPPPVFDVASLPPIESITAASDIRAFLAPGVPPELTRAALRRVWTTDPKIRDFVGMADYDWDFNMPGAVAGFGPLEMPDELRRELMRMVGRSLDNSYEGGAETRPAPTSPYPGAAQAGVESSHESAVVAGKEPTAEEHSNDGTSQDDAMSNKNKLYNSPTYMQRAEGDAAPQYDPQKPDNAQVIVRRPHGRGLPK